ncbi:MAG: ribokinase [Solirubrobacteraceae bacterium]|nr:ribokinase [Solirubrobacteraceae bacterium]
MFVAGTVNADFVFGVQEPPERGASLVARRLLRTSGGRAGNVAVMARRLGARARLFGCVGADELAQQALAGPRAAGADVTAVRRVPAGTGVVAILVAGGTKTMVLARRFASRRPARRSAPAGTRRPSRPRPAPARWMRHRAARWSGARRGPPSDLPVVDTTGAGAPSRGRLPRRSWRAARWLMPCGSRLRRPHSRSPGSAHRSPTRKPGHSRRLGAGYALNALDRAGEPGDGRSALGRVQLVGPRCLVGGHREQDTCGG